MEQLKLVGPSSLGVSLLTASFVGMVFTIQVLFGSQTFQSDPAALCSCLDRDTPDQAVTQSAPLPISCSINQPIRFEGQRHRAGPPCPFLTTGPCCSS